MQLLLISVFIVGYISIALEHPLKIDKAAIAIVTGVLCWMVLALGQTDIFQMLQSPDFVESSLLHHVGEIAEILFFLLAAMTIVELIDSHEGFQIISSKVNTKNRIKLLWAIGSITFVLSAVLDNLTTTIVMAAIIKQLVKKREDVWFFGGMVVIAANAGGAWSPIGDVTTIMLWVDGQITTLKIIKSIFLPSLVCFAVPMLLLTFFKRGSTLEVADTQEEAPSEHIVTSRESSIVLWLGVFGLLMVPMLKSTVHLPPFMCILLVLGLLWITTEILHKKKPEHQRHALSVAGVIQKVDTPSILFFLGILLAVASLETSGYLGQFAQMLDERLGNIYAINTIVGLMSAIIDNVPLVAGAMGMYSLETFPTDHEFWQLLAYCAGTGGSVLIIGSAAGVASMGLLKIDFLWYLKHISWLALIGYFSGIAIFYLLNM